MADEDEIDVLGDFSLEEFLSKNDSEMYDNGGIVSQNAESNCDCTSHWMLEHTTANHACWLNSGQSELSNDDNSQGMESQTGYNDIPDENGWTKNEKNLLERGIEIFGKSPVRLAQFVGTKTANEVRNYLKTGNINYYSASERHDSSSVDDLVGETIIVQNEVIHYEVLDDSEIPASIEEVIASASNTNPVVSLHSRKPKKSEHLSHADKKVGSNKKLKTDQSKGMPKFKFSTKMKISEYVPLKRKRGRPKKESFTEANKTTESNVPNTTNIPLNGEVIKLKKEEDIAADSDLEIDVENDEGTQKPSDSNIAESSSTNQEPPSACDDTKEETPIKTEWVAENTTVLDISAFNEELSELSNDALKQIMSEDYPVQEVILDPTVITESERFMHPEYFEGKAKTPSRYLKIRNHIINMWHNSRGSYVTKTSVRQGLKNCGDVNSISKIHQFLEQIGAINFGCSQVSYIRPLHHLLQKSVICKPKTESDSSGFSRVIMQHRPRIRKKWNSDGEGGYTLAHNEQGDVINTVVVNEEPQPKSRNYIKKPNIRLIYCKPFNENFPQEYSVDLHLSALLLMDFHAHSSHSEVMGLIGGYWDPTNKMLSITRYEPCKNTASSATHCDMCPVSQVRAAETLHLEGLTILGWFHSHPTFAPEPSQQDLDTQLSVQRWIGSTSPCIGVILSPYSTHGALIASPFRCMIVDKKPNFEDKFTPYRLNVYVTYSNMDIKQMLNNAWRIYNLEEGKRMNFLKPYFLDTSITYWDKFISSVRMHLAKCPEVDKLTCDKIAEGFARVCRE